MKIEINSTKKKNKKSSKPDLTTQWLTRGVIGTVIFFVLYFISQIYSQSLISSEYAIIQSIPTQEQTSAKTLFDRGNERYLKSRPKMTPPPKHQVNFKKENKNSKK